MTSNDIVARVIAALDAHRIPHMLVGAYSVNAYGVERPTPAPILSSSLRASRSPE